MTSNGGLSRRRVPAGSSTPDDGPSTTSAPTTSTSNGGGHAGSAFEGGNKIAFDPRDLEREGEDKKQGGKAPKLTIMEEVLLLGLKDKQVCLSSFLGTWSWDCTPPRSATALERIGTRSWQGEALSFFFWNVPGRYRICLGVWNRAGYLRRIRLHPRIEAPQCLFLHHDKETS